LESRRLLSTGDLDPTFGRGGKIVIDQEYHPEIEVTDAALQKDGKLVEVGVIGFSELAVARLNADGSFDSSFVAPLNGTDARMAEIAKVMKVEGASVAIQRDGKIVIGVEDVDDFYVLRLNSNGALDRTFGQRGIATVDLGTLDNLTDLAIQNDGKIVAVGYSSRTFRDPNNSLNDFYDNNLAVVRLWADGSLDRAFGKRGSMVVDWPNSISRPTELGITAGGRAASVALQRDGKMVVAGSAPDVSAAAAAATQTQAVSLIRVRRFNANGSIDEEFGNKGEVRARTGEHGAFAAQLAVDAKGRITVGGFSFQDNPENPNLNNKVVTLLRFNARGRADRSFGSGGVAFGKADGLTGSRMALAVQKNGGVVAGVSQFLQRDESAAYRFAPDGSPDMTFGANGKTPLAGSPEAVFFTRDGRSVFATSGRFTTLPAERFRAARLRADGRPDATFGNGGFAQAPLPVHGNDILHGMAVRSDGKVVVNGGIDIFSLPVHGGALRDFVSAYDDSGKAAVTFGPATGFDAFGGPIAVGPDDKLVVGDISNGGTNMHLGYFGAHRYNADGTLDTSVNSSGASTQELYIAEGGSLSHVAIGPDGRVLGLAPTYYGLRDDARWTTELASFFRADGRNSRGAIEGAESGAVDEFDPIELAFGADGSVVMVGTQIHRTQADGAVASAQIVVRLFAANLNFGGTFAAPTSPGLSGFTWARAVAVGDDGKITVAGATGRKARGRRIVLVRFNADGTPDTTFNGTGTLVSDLSGTVSNVVVQRDGRAVIAVNTSAGPVLARFMNSGAPDASFGDAGVLSTGLGAKAKLTQLDFAPDGKLVAGGTIGHGRRGRAIDLMLVRFKW
jgi:uncharacterized delta-60 repeat protein